MSKQESLQKETPKDSISLTTEANPVQNEFVPQSIDQQTANNIKNFLVNDYLKDELEFLQLSGHAEVMFDDELYKSKTFTF